jgi:hypothetical protein
MDWATPALSSAALITLCSSGFHAETGGKFLKMYLVNAFTKKSIGPSNDLAA